MRRIAAARSHEVGGATQPPRFCRVKVVIEDEMSDASPLNGRMLRLRLKSTWQAADH